MNLWPSKCCFRMHCIRFYYYKGGNIKYPINYLKHYLYQPFSQKYYNSHTKAMHTSNEIWRNNGHIATPNRPPSTISHLKRGTRVESHPRRLSFSTRNLPCSISSPINVLLASISCSGFLAESHRLTLLLGTSGEVADTKKAQYSFRSFCESPSTNTPPYSRSYQTLFETMLFQFQYCFIMRLAAQSGGREPQATKHIHTFGIICKSLSFCFLKCLKWQLCFAFKMSILLDQLWDFNLQCLNRPLSE